jgi:HrpA-like RNA helicase
MLRVYKIIKLNLTELGRLMTEFSLDPMLPKAVLASGTHKCSAEILPIVSMLSVNNLILFRPKVKILLPVTDRQVFFTPGGDNLILCDAYDNAYKKWKDTNYST